MSFTESSVSLEGSPRSPGSPESPEASQQTAEYFAHKAKRYRQAVLKWKTKFQELSHDMTTSSLMHPSDLSLTLQKSSSTLEEHDAQSTNDQAENQDSNTSGQSKISSKLEALGLSLSLEQNANFQEILRELQDKEEGIDQLHRILEDKDRIIEFMSQDKAHLQSELTKLNQDYSGLRNLESPRPSCLLEGSDSVVSLDIDHNRDFLADQQVWDLQDLLADKEKELSDLTDRLNALQAGQRCTDCLEARRHYESAASKVEAKAQPALEDSMMPMEPYRELANEELTTHLDRVITGFPVQILSNSNRTHEFFAQLSSNLVNFTFQRRERVERVFRLGQWWVKPVKPQVIRIHVPDIARVEYGQKSPAYLRNPVLDPSLCVSIIMVTTKTFDFRVDHYEIAHALAFALTSISARNVETKQAMEREFRVKKALLDLRAEEGEKDN